MPAPLDRLISLHPPSGTWLGPARLLPVKQVDLWGFRAPGCRVRWPRLPYKAHAYDFVYGKWDAERFSQKIKTFRAGEF